MTLVRTDVVKHLLHAREPYGNPSFSPLHVFSWANEITHLRYPLPRCQGTANVGAAEALSTPRGGREAPDHPLLLVGTVSDARHRHVEHFLLEPKLVDNRQLSGGGDAKAYRGELHDAGVPESAGDGGADSSASHA